MGGGSRRSPLGTASNGLTAGLGGTDSGKRAMPLIRASTSAIRRALLEQAGVPFTIERPDVDEARIQAACVGQDFELALSLAESKAANVSTRHPGDWVIGGDSVVSIEGRRF